MLHETFAPGRVELLGNHTDYNEGVVLSAALDLGISARGHLSSDQQIHLASDPAGEETFPADGPLTRAGRWTDYPLGVVEELRSAGHEIGGFAAQFASTLPSGAGLSSSAALEVATATLLMRLFDLELEAMEVAKLCRRAENAFVGVNCGLLDQASSIFGRAGHAVFLDCRSETVETVPFPEGAGLLIVNSGVKHALTGGEYNERRDQCFAAATALGVPALRDTSSEALSMAIMPELPRRRAAHVVGENERVFAAVDLLVQGDAIGFGALMTASHQSSMHNFENSTPELDVLVELATAQPGIHGARLTGGGFGGAIVAIGDASTLEAAGRAIASQYAARTGHTATPLVCHPGDGAWLRANPA